MSYKYNINKIHSNLQTQFSEVGITEKSSIDLGPYVELSIIKEDKEVKMIITKKDLEKYNFNWFYSENPMLESAYMIPRISNIDNITSDILDIFEKNRFSEDYIQNKQ